MVLLSTLSAMLARSSCLHCQQYWPGPLVHNVSNAGQILPVMFWYTSCQKTQETRTGQPAVTVLRSSIVLGILVWAGRNSGETRKGHQILSASEEVPVSDCWVSPQLWSLSRNGRQLLCLRWRPPSSPPAAGHYCSRYNVILFQKNENHMI